MKSRGIKFGVLGLVVVVLIIVWSVLPLSEWIEKFRLWILELGLFGVIAFAVIYVLLTVVLGPSSALTFAAGLAYGFWGFPLVVVSATVGAAAAFILGRYVAHRKVLAMVERNPRLNSLHQAISDESWRVVALLRLSPLIPYGVQNYLFSVTNIPFVPYVVATLFGIMPATALYVYIGSLGSAATGEGGLMKWSLIAAGLVATALVAWLVGKRASEVLARHEQGKN